MQCIFIGYTAGTHIYIGMYHELYIYIEIHILYIYMEIYTTHIYVCTCVLDL